MLRNSVHRATSDGKLYILFSNIYISYCLKVGGEYEDIEIIQIHKNKLIEHIPQSVVNQRLEDCRGVSESEGHH